MADDTTGAADQGPQTVVHAAAELDLGGSRLRQECWDSIPAPVRARLHELAGPVLYWWATPDGFYADQAPKAAVFGERGLYLADPLPPHLRPPAYSISGYDIVSGSMTVDEIEHAPAAGDGDHTAQPSTTPAPVPAATAESEASDVPDIALYPHVKGVLGNLPPRAQQLLQAPFATGSRIDRQEYYYEGYPHRLDVFVLFLAGDDELTIATGTKLIPDGHSDATAHWSLRIHRAVVTARPDD